MNIRHYCDQDKNGVIKLWQEDEPTPSPWNDPIEALLKKQIFQPGLIFIAEEGGEVVGTTMAGYDGHRGWIYSVVVDPLHRRKGVAASLLVYAEAELGKLGCVKINLQVRDGNDGAVALYKSLGYSVEPRVSMGKTIEA
ncbi:GNAT family acetyltransferase [Kiloniella antarctica]|uniref:GNAT family acetyltransferase n=1 Tax=Kiloniella antarctica TaxID=1550907 RepID=A0ABW5BRU0_9PROT